MKKLRSSPSHAINSAALGFFSSMAIVFLGCVSEPDGIRTDVAPQDPDVVLTAGRSADDDQSKVACEAFAILRAKCERCHGTPLLYGAPFTFASSEELDEVDGKGVARRERMADAIERGDMPPQFLELEPPVEGLSREQEERLLQWLRGVEVAEATRCD